jgi:hypothetical protein
VSRRIVPWVFHHRGGRPVAERRFAHGGAMPRTAPTTPAWSFTTSGDPGSGI